MEKYLGVKSRVGQFQAMMEELWLAIENIEIKFVTKSSL